MVAENISANSHEIMRKIASKELNSLWCNQQFVDFIYI